MVGTVTVWLNGTDTACISQPVFSLDKLDPCNKTDIKSKKINFYEAFNL